MGQKFNPRIHNGGAEPALADLLREVGEGDRAAFSDLYEQTNRRLFSICLKIVKNREAAEDVLHEVYVKIWNRSAGFDSSKGTALGWLAMIARNSAIDWVRARTRRNGLDKDDYAMFVEEGREEPLDEQVVRDQETSYAMEQAEEFDSNGADHIRAAFLEGLSYSDVAAREGLPVGTVKSRIRRTLQHLRRKMSDG